MKTLLFLRNFKDLVSLSLSFFPSLSPSLSLNRDKGQSLYYVIGLIALQKNSRVSSFLASYEPSSNFFPNSNTIILFCSYHFKQVSNKHVVSYSTEIRLFTSTHSTPGPVRLQDTVMSTNL